MQLEWRGAAVDPDDGSPSPEFWTPVDVPGRPAAFAGEEAVAYRTTFPDPRDGDEAVAVLVLRGVYAHARVWINGERRASGDRYFSPLRVPFAPAADNEVVVECRAPRDRFGGVHDTSLVPEGARVPGIWWGSDLETHPATYVSTLRARTRVDPEGPDGPGGAEIRVVAEVVAGEDLDDRVTFSLRPEGAFRSRGTMSRASVTAAAGERATVEHAIAVHDPSLWWPRELGEPNRYAVRAKLGDSTRTVTTGLCSVAYDEDDERLVVNGRRCPVRGVALVDATAADVERAADLGATLVRGYAGVLPESVYSACDEAGLLVWQDLPLYGTGSFDVDRGREVATALARARGRHPSLAVWSVQHRPTGPYDGLGSGLLDRLRFRFRAWRADHDDGPAGEVADALPGDRPAFPVVGPPGTGPDAVALYPGWDYGDPGDVDWLLERYPAAVVAEFGAGALGSADPGDGDVAGFDREKHDARVDGGRDVSQRYQARALKRVAEGVRRRDGAALVAATLRDTDAAGTGVFDSDGDPKVARDALAASFEPVQAVAADPTAGETGVVVLNDTPDGVEGRVAWRAGDGAGELAVSVEAYGRERVGSVEVPADAATLAFELAVGDRTVENRYDLG